MPFREVCCFEKSKHSLVPVFFSFPLLHIFLPFIRPGVVNPSSWYTGRIRPNPSRPRKRPGNPLLRCNRTRLYRYTKALSLTLREIPWGEGLRHVWSMFSSWTGVTPEGSVRLFEGRTTVSPETFHPAAGREKDFPGLRMQRPERGAKTSGKPDLFRKLCFWWL